MLYGDRRKYCYNFQTGVSEYFGCWNAQYQHCFGRGTAITNLTVQAASTTPAPEPTSAPAPSEPSTTQGESTTTSTPASTSTASTQGGQQVIPTIIEGAGSSYTQGSGDTIYFRSSDSFANFRKLW